MTSDEMIGRIAQLERENRDLRATVMESANTIAQQKRVLSVFEEAEELRAQLNGARVR